MKFDIEEYFKIKRKISDFDSYYSALYDLSSIEYNKDVETACVSFDKKSNSLSMQINYDFWNKLEEEEKIFVILHELSHIVLNHIQRIISMDLDFDIANIATDIVVNHMLNDKLGINRDLFNWDKYYWVENTFPGQNIPNSKNFEYYYNILIDNSPKEEKLLVGNHSENQLESKDKEPKKESNNVKSENKDMLKEILEKNPNVFDKISDSIFKKNIDSVKELIEQPIKNFKEEDAFEDIKEEDLNISLKKLINILSPNKKIKEKNKSTWVGQNRRYASFLKNNNNMYLPNEISIEDKDKKEVWIFMDTSGSCKNMFNYFGKISKELLKNKEVNCRAFSFDDYCVEININKPIRATYGSNSGGFDCIEEKVKELMKKEHVKYPDNIVVLSDGGVSFKLKDSLLKPKKWILLIDNEYKKDLTPPGGKYFNIKNEILNENNDIKKMKY